MPGVDARLTWVRTRSSRRSQKDSAGLSCRSGRRARASRRSNLRPAIAAGLTFRPAAETARDTLAWWRAEPEERRPTLRAGLTPEREAEVLAAWRAQAAARKG